MEADVVAGLQLHHDVEVVERLAPREDDPLEDRAGVVRRADVAPDLHVEPDQDLARVPLVALERVVHLVHDAHLRAFSTAAAERDGRLDLGGRDAAEEARHQAREGEAADELRVVLPVGLLRGGGEGRGDSRPPGRRLLAEGRARRGGRPRAAPARPRWRGRRAPTPASGPASRRMPGAARSSVPRGPRRRERRPAGAPSASRRRGTRRRGPARPSPSRGGRRGRRRRGG